MNIRKVRKKCMMRGCKNTDTYAISKTREFGGVILCKDCLSSALNEIKVLENPKKKVGETNIKKDGKNDTKVVNQGEDKKEPSTDAKTPAKSKTKTKTK